MSLNPLSAAEARRIIRHGLAAVCLFTLIIQAILVGTPAKAGAIHAQPAPAHISAPPEPFHIGGVSSSVPTDRLLGNTTGFSETILTGWNVVLGLIASKTVAKTEKAKEPAPALLTQPAASVDFDFDG